MVRGSANPMPTAPAASTNARPIGSSASVSRPTSVGITELHGDHNHPHAQVAVMLQHAGLAGVDPETVSHLESSLTPERSGTIEELGFIVAEYVRGEQAGTAAQTHVQSRWASLMTSLGQHTSAQDVHALVQMVLREAYMQNTRDLRHHAEKVKNFNEKKRLLRDYLGGLRGFQVKVRDELRLRGIDANSFPLTPEEQAIVVQAFAQHSTPEAVGSEADDSALGQLKLELGMPHGIPPAGITSMDQLQAAIERWGGKLAAVSEDAQLANIDLQNMLQRQQQSLQTMSNISKILHDTGMAIIRKFSS